MLIVLDFILIISKSGAKIQISFELWVMSYEFFCFKVKIMDESSLRNSSQSCLMDWYSALVRYPVLLKRVNQYIVSLAPFCDMDNLWMKSGVDSALNASLTLAPMEVPHRKSCLLIIVSFLVSIKYLYKLTMRIA